MLPVSNLSQQRPGFSSRSVYLEFEVEKVALGQNFLQVRPFSPFGIIPPILRILFVHLSAIVCTRGS